MPNHLPPFIAIHSLREVHCSSCALNPVCLPLAVDEADLDQLESIIERRRPLLRGASLFRQGDAFHALYAVRSGALKTCLAPTDGDEHITGFYLPGDIVGLDSLARAQHGCSAVALESTTYCAIPFAQLEALALKLPSLQHHLFKLLSTEIHCDQQLLLLLGKRSAEARIAAFLLGLASRYKRRHLSESRFHLPMSRTDIANHLGLAIETVSRVLTHLQHIGVLEVDGKDIEILDREQLCQLAEPAAEPAHGAELGMRKLP